MNNKGSGLTPAQALDKLDALYEQSVVALRNAIWICPYISRHLLSLNPLQARCRRYSRGER